MLTRGGPPPTDARPQQGSGRHGAPQSILRGRARLAGRRPRVRPRAQRDRLEAERPVQGKLRARDSAVGVTGGLALVRWRRRRVDFRARWHLSLLAVGACCRRGPIDRTGRTPCCSCSSRCSGSSRAPCRPARQRPWAAIGVLAACFLGLGSPARRLALPARQHLPGAPAIWVPLVSVGFLAVATPRRCSTRRNGLRAVGTDRHAADVTARHATLGRMGASPRGVHVRHLR